MGAASSREEDASRTAAREHTKRCRERRRLMREAVRLRRHLAASHAAYLRSLGAVASALTRFAVGEPIPVSDHTPPATIVDRPFLPPSSPPPLLCVIERRHAGEAPPQQDDGVLDVGAAATRTEAALGHDEVGFTVRHRSLAEVAAGLEEYFVKASVAGDTVSSLLETSGAEFKGKSSQSLAFIKGKGREWASLSPEFRYRWLAQLLGRALLPVGAIGRPPGQHERPAAEQSHLAAAPGLGKEAVQGCQGERNSVTHRHNIH
jgi:hypothetical protein